MASELPLLRQWCVLKLLSSPGSGMTVQRLADELELSVKTIRRTLNTLKTVGFPIEEQAGHYGRKTYRLDSGRGGPNLDFSVDEALALYLGRKFLHPLAGTFLWQAAQNAFHKIRASFSPRVLKYLDKVGDAVTETEFGLSDYARHAETIETLFAGMENRRVVFITYQSDRATEPVTYDIHPYRVMRHQGSLYVVGLKPLDDEVRTWRVDRIEKARLDPVTFAVPPDLNLDVYFAGSLGIYDGADDIRIRIRFSSRVARFVKEKRWHASQQLWPQRDGSLIAEFQLSSTVEVKRWVLSFGRDAVVLEPVPLCEEIAEEAAVVLAAYKPTIDTAAGNGREQVIKDRDKSERIRH